MRPERRLWHRLALALGMTVAEAQQRISSLEFSEWRAYSQVEPFGDAEVVFIMARLAALVANIARGDKRKPLKPKDFLPGLYREDERQPWQEQMKVFKSAWGASMEPGKIVRFTKPRE